LTYQAEKQIAELGDKVPADEKTKITDLIQSLKDAIAKDDLEQMKSQMTELQQALYAIGSKIYEQSGGAEGGPPNDNDGGAGPSASGGSDEDVIDAEFSETK
jgi:molecular chaperone DnaK